MFVWWVDQKRTHLNDMIVVREYEILGALRYGQVIDEVEVSTTSQLQCWPDVVRAEHVQRWHANAQPRNVDFARYTTRASEDQTLAVVRPREARQSGERLKAIFTVHTRPHQRGSGRVKSISQRQNPIEKVWIFNTGNNKCNTRKKTEICTVESSR